MRLKCTPRRTRRGASRWRSWPAERSARGGGPVETDGRAIWRLLAANERRLAAAAPFYGPFPEGGNLRRFGTAGSVKSSTVGDLRLSTKFSLPYLNRKEQVKEGFGMAIAGIAVCGAIEGASTIHRTSVSGSFGNLPATYERRE